MNGDNDKTKISQPISLNMIFCKQHLDGAKLFGKKVGGGGMRKG